MSDDIELNVDTLEPEEEEEAKAISEEEYSCGQRIPMRKPATLVQYWINTGNPPYKALLDENELSETGSSLSEKEITSPSASLVTNAINTGNKQKCKNDSSCSSVDTAAYILSNAHITKKADIIAIIEGAKCVEIKSLKKVAIEDMGVPSNDKIEYMETSRNDPVTMRNNGGNVDVDVLDTELHPMSTERNVASQVCDRTIANTLVSANAIQSNMHLQNLSCEETDKVDESSTSQRNLDVQTINDIASIFRQFDKTSKRLIENVKNNDGSYLDRDKMLEMDFHEKQVSEKIAHEIIAKDTSLTTFHRKKLYTGRDSPVDLILTETHGTSRLSGANQSLHPALDPDGTIKKESFLMHKSKNKHSLSVKPSRSFRSKKRKKRKELDCISIKTVTNFSNKYSNDNKIQDSTIDSSLKSLSDHNNSVRQDNIPFRETDDMNISVKYEKFSKQNLACLNLKPVVLLERIEPSFNQCKLKFSKNIHIAQKKNVCNSRHVNKFKKSYSSKIENLELETMDSDESTILICQCNINASQRTSSLSDCSLDLRVNIEDNFSVLNAEKKSDKLSSLKNTYMSQNKKLHIEGLPQSSKKDYTNAAMELQVSNKTIGQNVLSNKSKTYFHLYDKNEIDNLKLQEIKVVLERLPLPVKNYTITEMQVLNKNDAVCQKEISNKSKTHFSNLSGTNKKDNVRLQDIRIILERLPVNVCLKESSNVTNTNIFPDKKKILSQNTDLQTNYKRESQIKKILACENGATVRPIIPVRNNHSLRMKTKFKKNNDKINDTFGIVVERVSQVFDKIESDSTFQHKTLRHKNRSKASQDSSKYSILTFTSDEDDFVRSIQHPRKRSKISIDNDILDEPNIAEKDLCDWTKLIINDKDKYRYSRNLSTVISSSEKTVQQDIRSIKEKKEHSGVVKIKSCASTQTATASLQIHRNKGFFSSKDDNDSVADNLDKAKAKLSFFDSKKNTSNNSKRHSNGVIKKNEIDRKDNVHVIFFQTKTFDTNSSDSEESNSYTSPTYKTLKNSSTHNRLRCHNHANSEKIFNDSIVKRHNKRHLSLNSLQKHNRTHYVRTRLKSIDKKVKINKRLANEESNGDIKSKISDMRKDASSSFLINDIRNTSMQEKTLSNTLGILQEINLDTLSENKEILDKSKNSVVIRKGNVTSAVRKLTFQTKNYYDSSDSDKTL